MTEQTDKDGRRWDRLWRIVAWGGAGALLLTPLAAMQFTDEVSWTVFDFAVAAVMLAVPLGVLELTMRGTTNLAYRAAVVVALGTGLLTTWSNLAVGIIGDEGDPLNLIFFGVLAIAIVGAFIANFRARGMMATILVAGVVQAGTLALAYGRDPVAMVPIGVFAVGWFLSALLFQKAAHRTMIAA